MAVTYAIVVQKESNLRDNVCSCILSTYDNPPLQCALNLGKRNEMSTKVLVVYCCNRITLYEPCIVYDPRIYSVIGEEPGKKDIVFFCSVALSFTIFHAPVGYRIKYAVSSKSG